MTASDAVIGWRRQLPVYSPVSAAALLLGVGAMLRGLEPERARQRLLRLLQSRYAPKAALLTDSATSALTALLIAILRDRPGFAVALPSYACYDVATAADGADVPVLLYDVDPSTLAPDMASLQVILRRGVAAVVVIHFYGYPLDLTEVNRLAQQAGAIVVEDAAQSAGATLADRPVGGQTSVSVLSFGRGKGLTGGSGGALLANDREGEVLLQRARGLLLTARWGWSDLMALTAQSLLARPSLYTVPASLPFLGLGRTVYRKPRPLRAPTSTSCSVVAATWALAEREVQVRRRNAAQLLDTVRRQPAFEAIRAAAHARPGYLRLPVLASPAARRAVDDPAARRLGVAPGYPKALCDLERFAPRCLNRDAAFRGGRLLAARLCTIPTHSRLGAHDIARLERWIGVVGKE